MSKEDLLSEVRIIVSPNVIKKTIAELKKTGKVSFEDNKDLVKEIYSIQNKLDTEIIPVSNIIELTYYDNDPQKAVVLLSELMNQYIDFRLRVYNPVESDSFFSKNSQKYDILVDNKGKELMRTVNKTGVTEPQNEITNNLSLKIKVQVELNNLISSSIGKKSEIDFLDKILKKKKISLFSFVRDKYGSKTSFDEKLQILLVERGRLLRAYNAKSDKVKLLNKQIDDTFKILKMEISDYRDQLDSEYQAEISKIQSIRTRISEIDKANIILKEQALEHEKIRRKTNIYESSFDVFSKRMEEAISITSRGVPPGVSIIKSSFPSNGPVFPKKKALIFFGLIVGLLTGISFGFLREYFDHTFKKPEDVYKYAGLPVIFSMSEPQQEKKNTS